MTTATEQFAQVLQYLTDELTDYERTDEGIKVLIESLKELGPEVEDFTYQGYKGLKTALEEAEGLNDNLYGEVSAVLYECAVGVQRSALGVLVRACKTTPEDEELIQACLDLLFIMAVDSPASEEGLDAEQLAEFRGLSTVLGKYEDYQELLDEYEEAEIRSLTTLGFYLEGKEPVAAEAPAAEPETKPSFAKGLVSTFRKLGQKA